MASLGAEIVNFIKLQEDTMKLQQQLYISFLPNTSADDKIKMLQNLRHQLSTLQPLKNNYLKKKNRKQLNLVAYLKKTMVN
jgi:hypothetical protein